MSKRHFNASVPSAESRVAPIRSHARNHAPAPRRTLPWPRLAGAILVLIVVVGTFVWLVGQQSSSASSTVNLVGKPAPLATTPFASSQGSAISLSQFRGKKVVLFFYEGATCGSCQQELTLIQGLLAKRGDSVAVAASVDPIDTSTALAKQINLNYPIVADANHQLGSAFGDFHVEVAGMDMGDVDNHAVYVLDAKGNVSWAKQAADTMFVSGDDITAALDRA